MAQGPGVPHAVATAVDPEKFEEALWDRLKAFVEFDENDAERLRELGSEVGDRFAETAKRFYQHLLAFEETRPLVEDAATRRRLKESQAEYVASLFGGSYGDDYLHDRLRVGLTHERISLPLRWYLGSYWLYVRELLPRMLDGVDPEVVRKLQAFLKILLLDAQLISESYIGKTMSLMREQNERLELVIDQRTRQLTKWERLAVVGSMSSKVAHEIRNPLSSLSLNSELLSDELGSYNGVDTGEALELLESISSELVRLSRIVDEYLHFARMPRLDLQPVDLVDLLESIETLTAAELNQQGIALSIAVPNRLPLVNMDRSQVRQALLNLLRNSQEAMPTGGRVSLQVRERDSGGIVLSVEDSGVGFDHVESDKLFDPFFTTKDSGTGLGLPFVQQVMQEHRGEVRARGEKGLGARFDLVFPEDLIQREAADKAATES